MTNLLDLPARDALRELAARSFRASLWVAAAALCVVNSIDNATLIANTPPDQMNRLTSGLALFANVVIAGIAGGTAWLCLWRNSESWEK